MKYECIKCKKEFKSKQALDMHNSSKHPESYKEPLLSNKAKKKIKFWAIFLSIIILIVASVVWWNTPPKDAPNIEVTPSSFSFGDVSQALGVVNTKMSIKNTGSRDLIIDKIETSCGCTSAKIKYKGVESPEFGMAGHGTNPTDWQLVVPPGDSAELKVYYDPNVHKNMRGSVTRSVYIFSNVPRKSTKEVRISVTQTD